MKSAEDSTHLFFANFNRSHATKMAKPRDETKTKRSFIIIPIVNRTLETIEKVNRKNKIENMISFRFFRFLISQ